MFTLTKLVKISPKQLNTTCKYSHKSIPGATHVGTSEDIQKRQREIAPMDHLGEQPLYPPQVTDEPLPPWPNNTNPHTGEIGGPKGQEPTRYGDWERKGMCIDF